MVLVDYRIYSKVDGKTKHDHFWELLLMAKARGFSPKDVLFDTWYASLENLKQVRDHAIENYHRELKQYCGVERCQVRASRALRNHIELAVRAFLRLEWHFFTTGISAFEAKLRLVRDAVRSYLDRPFITLPKSSTA